MVLLTVNCTASHTAADTVEAIIAREIGANCDAVSTSAELKKHDPWSSGFTEVNCSSKRATASDTVEAIIAMEIGANSDKASAAAERKKCDPWASGFAEVNCSSKRGTASDMVDAIIARETVLNSSEGMAGGAGWKKVGSRTSVCSDNTSDTLSADEGQRDEDETRQHRVRAEEASTSNVVGTVLPTVVDRASNGYAHPGLPTSSTSALNVGVSSAFLRQVGNASHMPQTKELLSPFMRHLTSKSPDARHTLANGNNQTAPPAGSLVSSMLGRNPQGLCVRDVIHRSIEDQLQSSNPTSASLDNLWQLYTQNRGLLPVSRSALTADTTNESAQDLSCRSRERHSTAVKAPTVPAAANCIGPPGVVGLLHADKSPPPAHSHYGHGHLPVAPMQRPPPIVDRCHDPLYHLAEVAVQRGRVEVSGEDRHHSSPNPTAATSYSGQPVHRPSVHPSDLDRSDRGLSARPAGGSITLGTPRHPMLMRPLVPDISHRNLPQHATKVNDSLATAPQVVELAQEALRYLGPPDSAQRAVMEQVMAQVTGSFAQSNPSHTILMGDYVTAQQMQTSQHQQSTQPLNLPSQRYQHCQPLDHHTGVRDHVSSPHIPDLLARIGTDVSVNHMPVVQNLPQLPERPQHGTPSSPFIRRPLTAANVIDAIITHQISKEMPVSGTVLNRLPDPQVSSSNPHRVLSVNGSVQQDGSISSTDAGRLVYPPRHSIAERLEKERSHAANSHAAVAFRSQDTSKSTATSMSMAQLVTRAVTLGEHIDKMIQKDFSIPVHDNPPPTAVDVSRNGTCTVGFER